MVEKRLQQTTEKMQNNDDDNNKQNEEFKLPSDVDEKVRVMLCEW